MTRSIMYMLSINLFGNFAIKQGIDHCPIGMVGGFVLCISSFSCLAKINFNATTSFPIWHLLTLRKSYTSTQVESFCQTRKLLYPNTNQNQHWYKSNIWLLYMWTKGYIHAWTFMHLSKLKIIGNIYVDVSSQFA